MLRALHPHPTGAVSPVAGLTVAVARAGTALTLAYAATGATGEVLWPVVRAPERSDGLWRATCFEAFVRTPGEATYLELNFSPSTQWAAYRFDRPREGMRDLDVAAPHITPSLGPREGEGPSSCERISANGDGRSPARGPSVELVVAIDLAGALDATTPWRVALAAVIEDVRGAKTYWALAHPAAQPDFHHPESFVLDLSPEQQA